MADKKQYLDADGIKQLLQSFKGKLRYLGTELSATAQYYLGDVVIIKSDQSNPGWSNLSIVDVTGASLDTLEAGTALICIEVNADRDTSTWTTLSAASSTGAFHFVKPEAHPRYVGQASNYKAGSVVLIQNAGDLYSMVLIDAQQDIYKTIPANTLVVAVETTDGNRWLVLSAPSSTFRGQLSSLADLANLEKKTGYSWVIAQDIDTTTSGFGSNDAWYVEPADTVITQGSILTLVSYDVTFDKYYYVITEQSGTSNLWHYKGTINTWHDIIYYESEAKEGDVYIITTATSSGMYGADSIKTGNFLSDLDSFPLYLPASCPVVRIKGTDGTLKWLPLAPMYKDNTSLYVMPAGHGDPTSYTSDKIPTNAIVFSTDTYTFYRYEYNKDTTEYEWVELLTIKPISDEDIDALIEEVSNE